MGSKLLRRMHAPLLLGAVARSEGVLDVEDDRICNFVLDVEQISRVALELMRPDGIAGRRIDQLCHNSDVISRASHGPFEQPVGMHHLSDMLRTFRAAFETQGQALVDYAQRFRMVESGDQIVGNVQREITVVRSAG